MSLAREGQMSFAGVQSVVFAQTSIFLLDFS